MPRPPGSEAQPTAILAAIASRAVPARGDRATTSAPSTTASPPVIVAPLATSTTQIAPAGCDHRTHDAWQRKGAIVLGHRTAPATQPRGYTGPHERRVPMEPYQLRTDAGLPMTSTAAAERVAAFLRLVYGWMAGGLAITALVASMVVSSPVLL